MASAPLIKTPQVSGGTFYAFSSAARDLTKTLNNDNLKFEFSQCVGLNLPLIKRLDTATYGHYDNYIQFNTIDGAIFNGISGDQNINFAESLQNYALNFETLVLADSGYDSTLKKGVAERIFFKWLKEIGAIRFREATDVEKANSTAVKFVEEDEKLSGDERYKRVVQYVGKIDMVNAVEKAGETYTEIYLHMPTSVGNTPVVLFDALSDENYKPNLVVTGQDEYLYGRNSATIHPDGLSVNAFYDYDAAVTYTDPDANWHAPLVYTNSYYTERTTFEDASNSDITKSVGDFTGVSSFDGVSYRRSHLDGISISFDASDYYDIVNNATIDTIQQYNSASNSTNFEFNAMLVYYDVYDKATPNDRETNLYGILILDNIVQEASQSYFPAFQKYKPNAITKLNGNGWGLTVNLKFDASMTNGGADTIINEYNTFSMGLFSDATVKLQEAVKKFDDTFDDILDLQARVTDLEQINYSINTINSLTTRIENLETSFNNAQLALDKSSSLLDLISSNSDKIQQLVAGEVDSSLQYNTSILRGGDGINLDKSISDRIIIENKEQNYNFSVVKDYDDVVIDVGNKYSLNGSNLRLYTELRPFGNMARLYVQDTAISTLRIYIDDRNLMFKEGQTYKIIFPYTIDLNSYPIEIYTDYNDKFGYGSYGYQIAKYTTLDAITSAPIIELTCYNENSYYFYLDVIR